MEKPEFIPKPPIVVSILSFDRPRPKQSFRAANGRGYIHKDIARAERELREKAMEEKDRHGFSQPYIGPVMLKAVFYIPYASKNEWEWATLGNDIPMISPPDTGNLLKLAEDACKGVYGLYLDDSQVHTHILHKAYSPWTGFLLKFYLQDPVHPRQLEKRVNAYHAALKRLEGEAEKKREYNRRKRKEKEEAAAAQRDRMESYQAYQEEEAHEEEARKD